MNSETSIGAAIIDNLATFRAFEQTTTNLIETGDIERAIHAAQLAGEFAWKNPTGLMWSQQLEVCLWRIGSSIPHRGSQSPVDATGRVLHILSEAPHDAGGHVRAAWRWMQSDSTHCHNVAVVNQPENEAVSPTLVEAAVASGGNATIFTTGQYSALERIEHIRALLHDVDFVCLHIHPYDATTVTALAGIERPSTIFVNHADHVFWLGHCVVDTLQCFRDSGIEASVRRRNIARNRISYLPLQVEQRDDVDERDVRSELGIPNEDVVIVNTAHGYKLKGATGPSFLDVLSDVLREHPHAHMIKVGADEPDEWHHIPAALQPRIHVVGRQPDVRAYLKAANIYLDSFPLSSATSMLEGAVAGLACLTYSDPARDVLLTSQDYVDDGLILGATDLEEYRTLLSRLIEDSELRHDLGRNAHLATMSSHVLPGWRTHLARLYQDASLRPRASIQEVDTKPCAGALERETLRVHRNAGVALGARHYRELFAVGSPDYLRARRELAHDATPIQRIVVALCCDGRFGQALHTVRCVAESLDQLEQLHFAVDPVLFYRRQNDDVAELQDIVEGATFIAVDDHHVEIPSELLQADVVALCGNWLAPDASFVEAVTTMDLNQHIDSMDSTQRASCDWFLVRINALDLVVPDLFGEDSFVQRIGHELVHAYTSRSESTRVHT